MIIVSLFHVGICWNSSFPRAFPPCDESWYQLVPIQIGEDVSVGITLTEKMDESVNHWSSFFVWTFTDEKVSRCLQGTCVSHINARFVMKVNRKMAAGNYTYYVDMNILAANSSDEGTYNLRSASGADCAIFTVYVDIDTNQPICSTTAQNGSTHMLLSCEWEPGDQNETVGLVAGNHSLQMYEHNGVVARSNAINKNDDIFQTVNAIITFNDAFKNNMSPVSCMVKRYNVENNCKFQVFMLPTTNRIEEYNKNVFFTCCSLREAPIMWWYNNYTMETLLNPLNETVLLEIDGYDNEHVENMNALIFICGSEVTDELRLLWHR